MYYTVLVIIVVVVVVDYPNGHLHVGEGRGVLGEWPGPSGSSGEGHSQVQGIQGDHHSQARWVWAWPAQVV